MAGKILTVSGKKHHLLDVLLDRTIRTPRRRETVLSLGAA